nr:hypothetical protein OG781_04455 [Streptomyces sp. NBC_00830]
MVAEGTDKGELYSPEEDGEAADEQIGLSDMLLMGVRVRKTWAAWHELVDKELSPASRTSRTV